MQEKRDVFISHHTDSSAVTAKAICAALESAGVSCWYAPRDVEGGFAGSIVRAIKGCRVFLLLLNEHSNLSEHVLNEVNVAFERYKNHEDIALLAFKIGECTLCDDMFYYMSRHHFVNGIPPEVQRIQELADRICYLLDRKPERAVTVQERMPGQTAFSNAAGLTGKTYRITGKIMTPTTRFVGRRGELEQIRTDMTGGENKLFLVGMGGIGKSEIAKMYIKQHSDLYDVVLWASFDGSLQQTIANDSAFPIQGLSRSDYPEDSVRDYFERKMRVLKEISDRRVLVVLDNFDVTDDPDLMEFCGGSYSVLFTTRYHQESDCFPEIVIDGMNTDEDMLDLFRAEYTRGLDAAALVHVRQILDQLNGHPLSIRLVASAMQNNRIRPEKMVQMLKLGVSGMSEANGRAADKIFGRLRQVFQMSTLSDEEQHILMNLSLIPLRGISVELFYEWCALEDFEIIDGLIRKSWVIHNTVTDEVHLHPLVADLMAEQLAQHPECCMKLIDSLAHACMNVRSESWGRKQMLSDFASAIHGRLPQGHPGCGLALEAKAKGVIYLGLYRESTELYRQLTIQADRLDKKLEYYHHYSHSLILCGEAAQGYAVAEEGCALVKDMDLDQMSRMEGYYYNELIRRLSESCRLMGRYAEAVEYGRRALSFSERFYVDTPEGSRGWVEYHLAWALFCDGQLDEAEQTIRHSISRFEQIGDLLSANHSYATLAQILAERGKYEEALEMNRKSYQALLNFYSEEHAHLAQSLECSGNIYAAMGRVEEANACYRRAEEIYLKRNCVKLAQSVRRLIR